MNHDPFETIARIAQRTTSAVVSRAGTKSAALREYLASAMSGVGQPASFLRDPFLEAAHGYLPADQSLDSFAGKLLRSELIDALDGSDLEDLPDRERYRFRREWHPFRHQVDAWRALLDPAPKSVMVTSGTGSGKTECFLVPVLNTLVEQALAGQTMIGVQAIMLYPLNALINSQRERLSDWTSPFKGKVRFALYNGATPDNQQEAERRRRPEEVIDRKTLRETPPPILVTNITMLEYMLLRFEDRPILQASRGKLRYIILDEAHSYIGSQAAELSLLLRRVLFAFGVEPQNVRFIATSATIGKQGDADTKAALKTFLAQVAGVSETQVIVIEGSRKIPQLPALRAGSELPGEGEIATLDPEALFDRLGSTPSYVNGFSKIFEQPLSFKAWCDAIGTDDPDVAKSVLQAGTIAEKHGEKLLPLRVHAFHRAQPGAWACINPSCPGRKGTKLEDPSWEFGSVHLERSDLCPYCVSPLLEIKFCSNCDQVSLAAQKRPDPQGRQWLLQVSQDDGEDDFFSELEGADDTEGNDEADGENQDPEAEIFDQVSTEVLVSSPNVPIGNIQNVDGCSGQILDVAVPNSVRFSIHNHLSCPHCDATYSVRAARSASIRLGVPFLLGSIVPELLDDAAEAKQPLDHGKPDTRIRPADGRQILMFTDSRQGTARLSAKLQRDAEQNYVRAFIYHTLQANRGDVDPIERDDLSRKIAALRPIVESNPAFASVIDDYAKKLAELDQPKPITWSRMVNALSSDDRMDRFIRKQVWIEREPQFTRVNAFSEFLLLREFLRQPLRANSAETMGLAHLRFKHFDDLRDAQVPSVFVARGGTIQDWRDFLYIAMTKFARQNWCVNIDPNTLHWISPKKGGAKVIKPPGQKTNDKSEVGWPGQSKPFDKRHLVRILAQGLNYSLDNAEDRDEVDECMARAWQQFLGVCSQLEGGLRLNFEEASLVLVSESFLCPVFSGVLRDRTFRGLSPFVKTQSDPFQLAQKVSLPTLHYPFRQLAGMPVERAQVAKWLDDDPAVQNLRKLGIWSDLHDRIAQYSVYFRAAEHSAQQSGGRLKDYEREFKAGRINVLSCSTTMEMGVDIGSISTVVMTNVPPSVASYRQRVGRAGRRGQAMSLSLTLCKDRPIDRSVFRDPGAFLGRTIYAPSVALNSAVITQRHVNAMLLARFLAEQRAELHRITAGPFFGYQKDGSVWEGESPVQKFITWLDSDSLRTNSDAQLELFRLLRATALDGAQLPAIDKTRDSITLAKESFANEWEAIRFDLTATQDTGGRKTALELQLRRLCGEFLLGDLSGRGFLPGYGFPTDVVNFDNTLFSNTQQPGAAPVQAPRVMDGANRRYQLRDTPSRQLDLAIRDYAPGSDIVVDGQVFRSAGLRLAWKRPVTEEAAENIQSLRSAWRCKNCGAIGTSHATPSLCSACGGNNLTTHRFIKPSGFSCDPWVKPHDKIEEVNFVRPKAPWVAAQGGEWVHLTARESGRHRASRSGSVFHYTLGSSGHGYAICLACGRAEPEIASETEAPPVPAAMVAHRPLRSKRNAIHCDNPDSPSGPYVVQRHRALGYEISTDVFELQLPGIPSAEIALPLAAALRDALARKLGVEDAEMGLTVTQTMGEDDLGRWSILICDKAPGGAGFSVRAGEHIEELLADAAKILDCPNGNSCASGCAECVMCRDIESQADKIDRRGALGFATALVRSLGLPSELAVLGPETRAETRPLADAVIDDIEKQSDAELVLWLHGSPGEWNLNRWAPLRIAQRLAARHRRVRILIEQQTLDGLDQAARVELYGLAIKSGCGLEVSPPMAIGKDHRALAWIGNDDAGLVWASNDKDAWVAKETWGGSGREMLLRGPVKRQIVSRPIDPSTFLIEPERMAFIEVNSQLNGRIEDFGSAFWQFMEKRSPSLQLRTKAKSPLLEIEYSDRYLNSPLPVRLLREVLAKAPGVDAGTVVKLKTADIMSNAYGSSPNLFRHDWRVTTHRNSVLVGVFSKDFSQKFSLVTKDKRDVAHGRALRLVYADGVTVLHLDQGFGYWTTTTPVYFAFSAAVPDQIIDLRRATFQVRSSAHFATWIVINDER